MRGWAVPLRDPLRILRMLQEFGKEPARRTSKGFLHWWLNLDRDQHKPLEVVPCDKDLGGHVHTDAGSLAATCFGRRVPVDPPVPFGRLHLLKARCYPSEVSRKCVADVRGKDRCLGTRPK